MWGADLLVQTLAAAGVKRIFPLSGNQIMPIYEACLEEKIEIIHTRHEAAAVFMAESYAQLTGEVAVALVTAGAGVANTLGALFTCFESQTPVLLLTGDAPRDQDGCGAFQELDQVSMTGPVTKLSFRPKRPDDLGSDTARAIRTAKSGRQGPVHMALPFDLVDGDATGGSVPGANACARERAPLALGDIRLIAQTLAVAKRPLIICGPALNDTRSKCRLDALSAAFGVPLVAMESPRGLNDPALGNFAQALGQADVVVALGKRIDFTVAFGACGPFSATCRWIVVEPDADERSRAHLHLGKRLAACLAADPRDIIDDLIASAQDHARPSEWPAQVAALIEVRTGSNTDHAESGKITPAQLCAAVQRQLNKVAKSVIVCDGGEFGQWAQASTQADKRIINGISGTIGGGICYGLGARLAEPDATVFALMGDGTVGFHLAEFETAARTNTPFVVVIGNDQRWNAEHQIQMRDYGPDRQIGCELSDARYDEAAQALGGFSEYVTNLAELDGALDRAVNSGKVACVNVVIEGLPAPKGASIG